MPSGFVLRIVVVLLLGSFGRKSQGAEPRVIPPDQDSSIEMFSIALLKHLVNASMKWVEMASLVASRILSCWFWSRWRKGRSRGEVWDL